MLQANRKRKTCRLRTKTSRRRACGGEKLVEEIIFHGQPLKKLVLRASNNWDIQMCHTHIYPVEKTIY